VSAHSFVLRISTFIYSFAVSQSACACDVASGSNQIARPHLRTHPDFAYLYAGVGVLISFVGLRTASRFSL
jgi:hypothetical protein